MHAIGITGQKLQPMPPLQNHILIPQTSCLAFTAATVTVLLVQS